MDIVFQYGDYPSQSLLTCLLLCQAQFDLVAERLYKRVEATTVKMGLSGDERVFNFLFQEGNELPSRPGGIQRSNTCRRAVRDLHLRGFHTVLSVPRQGFKQLVHRFPLLRDVQWKFQDFRWSAEMSVNESGMGKGITMMTLVRNNRFTQEAFDYLFDLKLALSAPLTVLNYGWDIRPIRNDRVQIERLSRCCFQLQYLTLDSDAAPWQVFRHFLSPSFLEFDCGETDLQSINTLLACDLPNLTKLQFRWTPTLDRDDEDMSMVIAGAKRTHSPLRDVSIDLLVSPDTPPAPNPVAFARWLCKILPVECKLTVRPCFTYFCCIHRRYIWPKDVEWTYHCNRSAEQGLRVKRQYGKLGTIRCNRCGESLTRLIQRE